MTEQKRRYSPFPKPLANCVEALTRPVLKAQGLAGSRILTQWHDLVGPSLAAHSFPEKLTFPRGKNADGTLTIAVESGFATEMQYMQPAIIERLASYYGYKIVARITISHSYEPTAKPKLKAKKMASIPTDCSNFADDVEDGELKEALQSLAQTLSGKTA